ncbi:S8 family serine peptidase [Metabacillus dongyingensis]|uniref:S8 family serine peptidase n=1 Tax=Metabacillus dongyingensis TaxID=2874282 RepID=UPI001CBAB29B|nr:S8 family serine peptidase [Metabacillus dongyingensis]UAL51533.1 S8 family serine peptidase [Metabacillus dongyingensis]
MKNNKGKKLITGTLAMGLLLSASIPYNTLAENPIKTAKISNVEKVLSNLSEEQRRALEQLDVGPGFTIDPKINTTSPELVQVIVEFNQAPAKVDLQKEALKGKKISLTSAKEKVEASHKEFKAYVNSIKSKKKQALFETAEVEIKQEYKNAFNGVSMTLPGIAVEELLHSGTVKRIWSNAEVQLELPPEAKGISPKMADSIPQIGVDRLHDENIKGAGIKVGVLDTGIDYTHPDLAGAYKGYKAQTGQNPAAVNPASVKGWDFVADDADPMETTYNDWKETSDPEINPSTGSSYYTSHGTHVSGTVAAQQKNNVDYAVKGVAPEVDLYGYRVLGPYGSGYTEDVLAGIDKAVSDEMDVINLSLGASVNDPLYPTSVAINNAMLSGVVSVVSAGNAGPNEKTVGSPGTSAFGISVGASDAAISIPSFTAAVNDIRFESMKLLGKNFADQLNELEGQTLPFIYAGLGNPADFDGKDFNGKVALIERGVLTFDAKVQNAKNAGAAAVIIYNNADGDIPTYIGENTKYVPTFQLSKADGEKIKGLTESSITFNELKEVKTEGDSLADFSSRGPVNGNYDIKPDIVAPGVSIFSTYPEYMNHPEDGNDYTAAYTRMQGTSMAAPHITGVAALVLQQNPDLDPFEVKTAIMNTADDLKQNYSVFEVGAGRVDAYNAVHSKVSVKVLDTTENIENGEYVDIPEVTGSIGYGSRYTKEGAAVKDSRTLQIVNKTGKAQTYRTDVEYHQARKGVQDAIENKIQVAVPDTLKVGAGKTKDIQAKITVPENAEIGRYEGYIHLVNEQNPEEKFQVPFAIRVTDKGIDYTELLQPSVTNDTQFHQYASPGSPMIFKLKSPLKQFDLVLKDAKTGEPLGITGSFDGTNAVPDREYFIRLAFRGIIFPFTGNEDQPISEAPVRVPAGEYSLEMIGHDEDGKTYSVANVAVVDNTPPKVDLDVEPGVVEIDDSMLTEEDGYRGLWVHGSITDSTVDLLASKGYDYTQKSNTAAYYENNGPFIGGFLKLEDNGDTKFGVLPEEYETKPYQLRIFPWDIATAANVFASPNYVFMKEGTEHATNRYNKQSVKIGSEITMTLDLNNVKRFMSGEFEIDNTYSDIFKFQSVKVNRAFDALAKQKGVKVDLHEAEVTEKSVKVGASLSKEGFKGFDGDLPFLDVTFKIIDDTFYSSLALFNVTKLSYIKAGQTEPTILPAYSLERFNFISKHSQVTGSISPEAFLTSGGYLENKNDYSKMGFRVYAKAADGSTYPGTIDERGQFKIPGIPVSKDFHTVYIEANGHTITATKVMLSKPVDGKLYGISQRINPNTNLAGDINRDEMIDIRDLEIAVNHYGKTNPSNPNLDIDQDGIVGETDVRFIEKNFLAIGALAPEKAKPKEKIGKNGLAEFLKKIGLAPKNS